MKEVLSLPASKTQDIINKYLIHAHPHPRNYKSSKFLALRKNGGIMDTIYSVEAEVVLRPNHNSIEEKVKLFSSDIRMRLLEYIQERKETFGFNEKEEYKFYVLKVEYRLNHQPRPVERILQSHTYYTLREMISGKAIITRETANK